MSREIIITLVQLVVLVAAFVLGKFVFPKIPSSTIDKAIKELNYIINYADIFVPWAKKFMSDSTGEEKMDEVVKQLSNIAKKQNIDITEDEIRAIAQKAYNEMKNANKIE